VEPFDPDAAVFTDAHETGLKMSGAAGSASKHGDALQVAHLGVAAVATTFDRGRMKEPRRKGLTAERTGTAVRVTEEQASQRRLLNVLTAIAIRPPASPPTASSVSRPRPQRRPRRHSLIGGLEAS
jgi:hypothetical protein